MSELQSIDGSFLSRDTDEEKSLDSNEDTSSILGSFVNESRKAMDKGKTVIHPGNDDSEGGASKSFKQSAITSSAYKNEDNNGVSDKGNNSDNTSLNDKQIKKKTKKIPHRKNLNEPTLMAIDRYLKSGRCFSDTLEYEEVAVFTSKIHRYAVERTRGRQGMLFRDGTIQNGDDENIEINTIIMTEDDIAQEYLYHQIYQKEEYHAVATKFSKTVTEGCHAMGKPGFVLHTKTANWLKRAAGMQRQYDPYEKDDNQKYTQHNRPINSEESDQGDGEAAFRVVGSLSDRRLTRRRVEMTRKKRWLERLERENENFRIMSETTQELSNQTRTRRSKKGIKRMSMISDIPNSFEDDELGHTISSESRGPISDEIFPSLESTVLGAIHRPYYRRDDSKMVDFAGSEALFKMENSILPSVIASIGLEFRSQLIGSGTARNYKPYTKKTSDGHRALKRKSSILMNALSNKRAKLWVVHEFFYSDIDKEWYLNDGFASDLAKLGLPIDLRTRLKKEEWIVIRKKLRSRPRLFSKRFIAEQLKRRNRYRALIRKLQQDPTTKKFSPIPVGTTVNAYDKHGGTIRRGRILRHNRKNYTCLVQFYDKAYGCAVCLDSEVAISQLFKPQTNQIPVATAPPLYKPFKELLCSNKMKTVPSVENFENEEEILSNKRTNEIERELLISSVVIVTEAFQRKRTILEALEISIDDTKGDLKHCSRLLANLDRINLALKLTLSHVHVLYGKIYGSLMSNDEEAFSEKNEKMKLCTETPKSKVFEELVKILLSISNKIGTVSFSSFQVESKNSFSFSKLLVNELSSISSLLLLANYLAKMSLSLASSGTEETSYSKAIDAILKISFERYSKNCLSPIPDTLFGEIRLEQESLIEDEVKDLWIGVGMLRTEVSLATDESRWFELRNTI